MWGKKRLGLASPYMTVIPGLCRAETGGLLGFLAISLYSGSDNDPILEEEIEQILLWLQCMHKDTYTSLPSPSFSQEKNILLLIFKRADIFPVYMLMCCVYIMLRESKGTRMIQSP